MSLLLIRDLLQVVSPAGRDAPLRGARCASVSSSRARTCSATARRSQRWARWRSCRRSTERSKSSTAAVCAPFRASSTATRTRPSAATASRSSRAAQPARATRSCTRQASASSRPSERPGQQEKPGSPRQCSVTATGCSAPARRPSRESRATASTARPSWRRCARSRAAGGIPTWLGAHATPPGYANADAYLDFILAEVLPDAAQLAEAADVFLERGAFDATQARRYLEACRTHGLELRLHGDQFTEAGAIPLAIELGARSVDHLEATGPEGIAALAASDVTGVLLPASALFLGATDATRSRARRRGRRHRPGDRLQPRERVLRKPPARMLARRDPAQAQSRRRRSPPAR